MGTLLEIGGLSKSYPGVKANDDISFVIQEGEIHALLGENGAGKSTLVKMIYGLVKPDSGTMVLRGEAYTPAKPIVARKSGVSMVFQHFSLFEALTVAENITLGMDDAPNRKELSQKIRTVSEDYGLPLDPDRLIGDMSVGERQRVEIIRCLLQNPRLLIMDEPTSVLTPQEVDTLFSTLRKLSADGVAILYISHKLDEILALCDHATILRMGKVVDTCTPKDETAKSLAEMMIGGELEIHAQTEFTPGEVALSISGLSLASKDPFGTSLKDISLNLRKGEILGIGGVAGNGQDELLAALSGEAKVEAGMLKIADKPIGQLGPNERRSRGLLTAPEERLGHAAAPMMSLSQNAFLTGRIRKHLSPGGVVNSRKTNAFARDIVKQFDVRTPGIHVAAKALSGGNLQKFVIGREILQEPSVLVVNQPTWGVDAAAAAFIRQALRQLAARGAAVIVISQDLDELMEMSDTFAVLSEGRLSKPQPSEGLTIEEIGLMMGGDLEGAAHV
ncbi:MAG: ABC transporter ATP-binding protein [Rhodobacteraceae bacterium]|nr:ABC transporter ATP-binding protein [Paracoccaceae bacterium]